MAEAASATPTTAAGPARIAAAFEGARAQGRAALMPYMVGGFPGHAESLLVADEYVAGGADLIELGVPFSDPLADGPVIHAAATAALQAGATLDSVLEICASVSDRVAVLLMVYSNMVLARGPEDFAAAAVAAGAAGAIVPDLALEEAAPIRAVFDAAGLALVPLVAPTTPPARRKAICEVARGFVYVVSDVGVTGERAELPHRLTALVEGVRGDSRVPVAVGFGIGTSEQAAAVGAIADGAIIGSRLVRELDAASDAAAGAAVCRDFLRSCIDAMTGGASDRALVSSRPVQLVVFTTLGLVAFFIAYAFGLGGTVGALIFLSILLVGVTLRVAEPLLAKLRP